MGARVEMKSIKTLGAKGQRESNAVVDVAAGTGRLISEVRDAFESLLRCPNARKCIEETVPHPCSKIAASQLTLTGAKVVRRLSTA